LGPPGRTLVLSGLGLLSGIGLSVAAVLGLAGPERTATELATRAVPGDIALGNVAAAMALGQATFLAAVDSQEPADRAAAIAASQEAGRQQDAAWNEYLHSALDRPGERAYQLLYAAAATRTQQLAATVITAAAGDPARATTLDSETSTAAQAAAVVARIDATIYRPTETRDVAAARAAVADARNAVMLLCGALTLMWIVATTLLLRGARRDDRTLRTESDAIRVTAEAAEFEGALQRGLEMAPTEGDALEIVGQALSTVAGGVPLELLLADSSRAHFRQALAVGCGADSACRVGSPAECPAASASQTRLFEDSTQLDTCRFLRGAHDPVWAVCVPISIAGRATGVIHAQGRLPDPPPPRIAAELEMVARKVGERIGGLRIFARTEAQARVDPLTGLPNRRTLESQVQEIRVLDGPFVVAFADLDHFKAMNDEHSHETGDRALRLFARVLRTSIRPRDLVARYGGEEFVVVLPECSLADARVVAERVRAELAAALAHATVPAFTVTIGLAEADPGDELADVIAGADAAMLCAKSMGRDRVADAGEVAAYIGAHGSALVVEAPSPPSTRFGVVQP
jgi:diguanylate cyclase (GGDEF)-like protein